jgi:ADP-ribosylglycohydrolase
MINKNYTKIKLKTDLEDRCFGCILGAFIGDACGSFNEFNTQIANEDKMNKCMEMPGGGPFEYNAPG